LAKTEGFQGSQVQQRAEHAAIQVAATAKAEVEAAFIIALKMPRNKEQSRVEILDSCKNLIFAEKVLYKKPVGGGKSIEGPSIRFAEEAIRTWGNVKIQHYTIYEDAERRLSMVNVIDLEKNISYSKQMVIEKTVERKNSKGRIIMSERLNSYNERVFIVAATDDELRNKEAAMLSKEIRNASLRIIPQDIIDEAIETTRKTIITKAANDPQAEKKKIIDSFNSIGLKPIELEKYLNSKIDTISPAQIVDLRAIYTSIKDGQSVWKDYVDEAEPKKKEETAEVSPDALAAGNPEDHQPVDGKKVKDK